jgi:type II secretory pathway pseudopilin PulG
MKKTIYKSLNLWFTMIELVVVMTIITILWSFSFNFYNSYKREQIVDDEISDVQQYWYMLTNIINKKGDILLNYCKNTSWTYDNNCFSVDPLLNGNSDNTCLWKESDLINDIDCDNNCVVIDCEVTNCSWNNIYYDFDKLFNEQVNYNYTLKTDSFKEKLSYRICPEKDINNQVVIWKGDESENGTFNPSFTLYYSWRPVYKYNSNP